MNNKKPGAPRREQGQEGPAVGTGGHGRKALEGKGPTPKAEDRTYHVAGKRKAAQERLEAARARSGKAGSGSGSGSGGAGQGRRPQQRAKKTDESEVVTGRNSVVEALRAKIPATALYIAARIDYDDRVKEALSIATKRGLPVHGGHASGARPAERTRLGAPGHRAQGAAVRVRAPDRPARRHREARADCRCSSPSTA